MTALRQIRLSLALLATALPGAALAQDATAVSRCESAVMGAIQNPASYRRMDVSVDRTQADHYAMIIGFEATNIYGEPIAARGVCYFRAVAPSPRERENCPECQVFVLDGLDMGGGFRPGERSEPRIVSGGS